MAEFRRSRIEKKSEDEITKKTILLGILTVVVVILILTFGLPLLIKFSVFLGEAKKGGTADITATILPPLPPRIILPFEATNSSQIAINGLAEKNITVELLKNDVSVGKVAANDAGEFSFGGIGLDQGESVFTAVAINGKGINSEPSKEVRVVFSDIKPTLTMVNPAEDSLKVSSSDFDVIGQSDKGVSVLVNGSVAMVDDNGKFKIKLQLNTGDNQVEIIVRDIAGNETKKTIKITYDI